MASLTPSPLAGEGWDGGGIKMVLTQCVMKQPSPERELG
jgi:hypothetical protein